MSAQLSSIVALSDTGTVASLTLPLPRGLRIYVDGIERAVAQQYGEVVDTAESADVAIGPPARALREACPLAAFFDIPSSMESIASSRPDVPFDTEAPRFRFGDGLSYV